MLCSTRSQVAVFVMVLVTAAVLMPSPVGHCDDTENTGESTAAVGDVYFMIGQQAAWLGNRIRYTVYETTTVEARFLTAAGEIIILMPLGEQEPGQYTLPWHTHPVASAMAGIYKFELYFGDEYAVNTRIVVAPPVRRPT
ncbi:MAG: hypothetical protein GF341_07785 [candidate division Zixibacteria bacterium]|nr:hypothetical protein [candidate division Zixibacteria bacterium]